MGRPNSISCIARRHELLDSATKKGPTLSLRHRHGYPQHVTVASRTGIRKPAREFPERPGETGDFLMRELSRLLINSVLYSPIIVCARALS